MLDQTMNSMTTVSESYSAEDEKNTFHKIPTE